ncbi:MAG TPA: hypothetical protein VFU02_16720 [Polyangiaceae bacterium]|nr:hypothetical protein [Polyangiaceae bacterium]
MSAPPAVVVLEALVFAVVLLSVPPRLVLESALVLVFMPPGLAPLPPEPPVAANPVDVEVTLDASPVLPAAATTLFVLTDSQLKHSARAASESASHVLRIEA